MVNYTRDVLAHKVDQQVHDIGAYTYGSPQVHWWRPDARLIIGRYCSIAGGVNIFLGGNHRLDWVTTYPFSDLVKEWPSAAGIGGTPVTKGDVKIGNDVWIGSFATILSGVTIGNGAVIGAGAVVGRDVPPYGIAVGNPARVIRYRFSEETIERLQKIQWWNWAVPDVMKALPSMLQADLSEFLDAYDPISHSISTGPAQEHTKDSNYFHPDGEEGVSSPIKDGLVLSLDFGARNTLEDEWGAIESCSGADGTKLTVRQDNPAHRPTRSWKNGRYAARFVSRNKQNLIAIASDELKNAISHGAHTVVCIAQPVEIQSSCVVDIARQDSAIADAGANRTSLILDANRECWTYRHGSDTIDVRSPVVPEKGTPKLFIASRSNEGEIQFIVDGATCSGKDLVLPPIAPEVLTVGARFSDTKYSMYLDGYIWRIMIFNRLLTSSEIETLSEWARRYFHIKFDTDT